MPAVSPQQYGMMQGILHGAIGGPNMPSKSVAQDFVNAAPSSKRSSFAKALARKRKKK